MNIVILKSGNNVYLKWLSIPCFFHRSSMGPPSRFHEYSMGIPWAFHEDSQEIPYLTGTYRLVDPWYISVIMYYKAIKTVFRGWYGKRKH